MSREDGGPAFPCYRPEGPKMMDGYPEHEAAMIPGMTLRDYFAAKAMPAAYRDLWDDVRAGRNGCVPGDWRMGVALDAYQMADAMLAARKEETR